MGQTTVAVTGASGQTGSILARKVAEAADALGLRLRAIVRSPSSQAALEAKFPVVKGQVMVNSFASEEALKEAFQGCDKLVILTSAKPKLVFTSLFGVIMRKYVLRQEGARPSFYYLDGQEPKVVDWAVQKRQIDAAKAAGVKHIILVGSMGGTKPDHFLNTMGGGNILLWKRKAEKYLIASGMTYTIIHPGGLLPHPGMSAQSCEGGKRELTVGIDDALMDGDAKHRVIPREDLAEVCLQCLRCPQVENTSWDLTSKPEGEGKVWNKDLAALIATCAKPHCNYDQPKLPE